MSRAVYKAKGKAGNGGKCLGRSIKIYQTLKSPCVEGERRYTVEVLKIEDSGCRKEDGHMFVLIRSVCTY
jgi:hypothetical protein